MPKDQILCDLFLRKIYIWLDLLFCLRDYECNAHAVYNLCMHTPDTTISFKTDTHFHTVDEFTASIAKQMQVLLNVQKKKQLIHTCCHRKQRLQDNKS